MRLEKTFEAEGAVWYQYTCMPADLKLV